jgi:hypothetical protein
MPAFDVYLNGTQHRIEKATDFPVLNPHTPASGTPPQIEERPGQYLGYFENEFGEQMIFVFDRSTGTGLLYAGDAG